MTKSNSIGDSRKDVSGNINAGRDVNIHQSDSQSITTQIPLEPEIGGWEQMLGIYRFFSERFSNKTNIIIFSVLILLGAGSVYDLLKMNILPRSMDMIMGAIGLLAIGFFSLSGNTKCSLCGSKYSMETKQEFEVARQRRTNKPDRIQIERVLKCAKDDCNNEVRNTYWQDDE